MKITKQQIEEWLKEFYHIGEHDRLSWFVYDDAIEVTITRRETHGMFLLGAAQRFGCSLDDLEVVA